MKTETIIITTTKTLMEISRNLRSVASHLRADISSAESAPFGNVGIRLADISICLSGSNSILGGPRKWGVQVLVTDTGRIREVELIAVGDNLLNIVSLGSYCNAFFQLGDSIRRRDKIANMIR